MEQPDRFGTYVDISLPGRDSITYEIRLINESPLQLYVSIPGTETYSVIYPDSSGIWKVNGAETTPYIITFPQQQIQQSQTTLQPQNFSITTNSDVDLYMLSFLDDNTLTSTCQVNKYYRELCNQDILWQMKIKNTFANFPVDIFSVPYKPLDTGWKDWYINLKFFLLTNVDGVRWAARNGYIEILQWLASQNPPILPDKWGVIWAAEDGQLEVLKWLALQNPPILPDTSGANYAAGTGQLEVLKWLALQNPPILPDNDGATGAAINEQLKVLQWLASQNPPILPDKMFIKK